MGVRALSQPSLRPQQLGRQQKGGKQATWVPAGSDPQSPALPSCNFPDSHGAASMPAAFPTAQLPPQRMFTQLTQTACQEASRGQK